MAKVNPLAPDREAARNETERLIERQVRELEDQRTVKLCAVLWSSTEGRADVHPLAPDWAAGIDEVIGLPRPGWRLLCIAKDFETAYLYARRFEVKYHFDI